MTPYSSTGPLAFSWNVKQTLSFLFWIVKEETFWTEFSWVVRTIVTLKSSTVSLFPWNYDMDLNKKCVLHCADSWCQIRLNLKNHQIWRFKQTYHVEILFAHFMCPKANRFNVAQAFVNYSPFNPMHFIRYIWWSASWSTKYATEIHSCCYTKLISLPL